MTLKLKPNEYRVICAKGGPPAPVSVVRTVYVCTRCDREVMDRDELIGHTCKDKHTAPSGAASGEGVREARDEDRGMGAYAITLQRMIEAHCRGELLMPALADKSPHLAEKLNADLCAVRSDCAGADTLRAENARLQEVNKNAHLLVATVEAERDELLHINSARVDDAERDCAALRAELAAVRSEQAGGEDAREVLTRLIEHMGGLSWGPYDAVGFIRRWRDEQYPEPKSTS